MSLARLEVRPFQAQFWVTGMDDDPVACVEQCYPFDTEKGRFAYRTTEEGFENALMASHERDCRKRIDRSSCFCRVLVDEMMCCVARLDGDYLYVTTEMANMLVRGGYWQLLITAGSPWAEDWVAQFELDLLGVAALEAILRKRPLARLDEIGEQMGAGPQTTFEVLSGLRAKGYVTQDAQGGYSIARTGFTALAETARLSEGGLPDLMLAGTTWSDLVEPTAE